jgi:hypothetical protein
MDHCRGNVEDCEELIDPLATTFCVQTTGFGKLYEEEAVKDLLTKFEKDGRYAREALNLREDLDALENGDISDPDLCELLKERSQSRQWSLKEIWG